MTDGKDAALAVIAILHDPVRAKLFRFIRRRSRPVTREEAATAAGISRKLAAFHLDKLVDAGLLTAAYPVSARRTPGRPPKAYTAAQGEWQVSVPERRYDVLAELLTRAVLTSAAEPARQAATRVAADTGRRHGERVRAERRLGRLGRERALTVTADVLEDCGYEPDRGPGHLELRNCPFAQLASGAPELVCTLNHHLIGGLLAGLGAAPRLHAVLVPAERGCCVQVRAAQPVAPSTADAAAR